MPANVSLAANAQPRLDPEAPKVRITTGNGSPSEKSWNLRRPVTMIGSRRTAHILLRHPEVSKAHCLIVNTGWHAVARDLNSRTGTTIGGEPLGLAALEDGAVLKVGPVEIEVALQSGTRPAQNDPLRVPFAASLKRRDGTDRWELTQAVALIGRKDGCEVQLDQSDVSLAHAVVCHIDEQLAVFDLGSRTGTWLNGKQIHYAILSDGDVLRVGAFEFDVVTDAQGAPGESTDEPDTSRAPAEPSDQEFVRPPAPAGATEPTDISEPIDDEVVPLDWQAEPEVSDRQAVPTEPMPMASSAEAQTESPESFVNELEQNLMAFQQNLTQSARRLTEWQAKLEGQTAKLEERERNVAQLAEALGERESQVARQQEAFAEQSSQLEQERSELAASRNELETTRTQALAEIDERTSGLEAREKQFAEQESSLTSLKGELDERESGLAARSEALAEEEADLATRAAGLVERTEELDAQRQEIEVRAKAVEAAFAKLENDQADLTEKTRAAEALLESERAEIEARAKEIDDQREALEATAKQLESQQAGIESARTQVDERAEQLDARQAEFEAEVAAMTETKERVARMSGELDARQAEIEQREAAIQEAKTRVEQEHESMRKQASMIHQVQSALAQANAAFEAAMHSGRNADAPELTGPIQEAADQAAALGAPDASGDTPRDADPTTTSEPDEVDNPSEQEQHLVEDAAPEVVQEAEPAPDVAVSAEPTDIVPPPDDSTTEPADEEPAPAETSPAIDLDPETLKNLRMLRRLGAKGSDEELLAQLAAKKGEGPDAGEGSEDDDGKKRRWWSR